MSEPGYRQKCLAQKINACNVCGETEDLLVHHINGDRTDNQLENLTPLCSGCHAKVHGQVRVSGRIKELKDKLPDTSIRHTPRQREERGGRSRALMTETDRERIASSPETAEDENYRYQAISRVRDRLDELEQDVETLDEHHPDLLAELREVVCEGGDE